LREFLRDEQFDEEVKKWCGEGGEKNKILRKK
jgi:hypothetical protein